MNNFERVAATLHRQPVHQSALDAAIEDAVKVKKPKALRDDKDLVEWAKEEEKEPEHSKDSGTKSPAARGHEGGLIGGPKRDEVLSSEEKTKIARKGGYARWGEAKSERE